MRITDEQADTIARLAHPSKVPSAFRQLEDGAVLCLIDRRWYVVDRWGQEHEHHPQRLVGEDQ